MLVVVFSKDLHWEEGRGGGGAFRGGGGEHVFVVDV